MQPLKKVKSDSFSVSFNLVLVKSLSIIRYVLNIVNKGNKAAWLRLIVLERGDNRES